MSVPPNQMFPDLLGAVDSGIQAAEGIETPTAEIDEVKKLNKEYAAARDFDKETRRQYNKDRRYASGTADMTWASDANIIGSFIDILVSFLYAKDPDTSVKPARRVAPPILPGMPPLPPDQEQLDSQKFAETLQIVISRLWKDARLKRTMKKVVRSSLSVGVGWFKARIYSETKRNPQIEKQLHDMQDNLAEIEALKKMLGEAYDGSKEDLITELNNQMTGLSANIEEVVKRGMCIDFCRAEDVQVSLDVSDIGDYLDADWVSNDMYIRKDSIIARFPDLTEGDLKPAVTYYQRKTSAPDKPADAGLGSDTGDGQTEGAFTKSTDNLGPGISLVPGGEAQVPFLKVIELWDHRDTLIKTFIDGVEKWAVKPYAPPQAASRYYPFFQLALFEVDGSRQPQSLSWRMRKLQDEYSTKRSNGRLTTERSVPGTVFNRGQLSTEDADKLQNSVHMEMVGIMPTDQSKPLDQIITAKPIPRIDPMIFDTTNVLRDMQIVSGVQEAQAQSSSQPNTATEAEIQNQGFASRTGADRDTEEDLLNDLAQYTAETSVQSLPVPIVQRMAGKYAFWPEGMDVQDVLMMLDVEIKAGTTGKPGAKADKETWATLLPLIQQMMTTIQGLELTNPPLAQGYRNLLSETLLRLDDTLNIDMIFPSIAGMMAPPVVPPGTIPGGVPDASGPPVGNGTVNNPATVQPPAPPV